MKDATITRILRDHAEEVFTEEVRDAMFSSLSAELANAPSNIRSIDAKPKRNPVTRKRGLIAAAAVAAAFAFIWLGTSSLLGGSQEVALDNPTVPLGSFTDSHIQVASDTLTYPVGTKITEARLMDDLSVTTTTEGTLVFEDGISAIDTSTSGTTLLFLTFVSPDGITLDSLPIYVVIAE